MTMNLTLNQAQFDALKKEMASLELTAEIRKRLLYRILKNGIMPAAKRHQKNQASSEGVKWQGRRSRSKKKMIRKLPGTMTVNHLSPGESAVIKLRGNKKTPAGIIGQMQQDGAKNTVTAQQVKARQKNDTPATLSQAKRLRGLGFTLYPVTKPRRPSLKEITQTMSAKQAGLIIRLMENRESKDSWTVTLPAREWLAASNQEFNEILARQMNAIHYGGKTRPSDIKG